MQYEGEFFEVDLGIDRVVACREATVVCLNGNRLVRFPRKKMIVIVKLSSAPSPKREGAWSWHGSPKLELLETTYIHFTTIS